MIALHQWDVDMVAAMTIVSQELHMSCIFNYGITSILCMGYVARTNVHIHELAHCITNYKHVTLIFYKNPFGSMTLSHVLCVDDPF